MFTSTAKSLHNLPHFASTNLHFCYSCSGPLKPVLLYSLSDSQIPSYFLQVLPALVTIMSQPPVKMEYVNLGKSGLKVS
jgi:hypothetical protein